MAKVAPAPAPEVRCHHCGLRQSDHGKMSGGCFVKGRAVRTKWTPVSAYEVYLAAIKEPTPPCRLEIRRVDGTPLELGTPMTMTSTLQVDMSMDREGRWHNNLPDGKPVTRTRRVRVEK